MNNLAPWLLRALFSSCNVSSVALESQWLSYCFPDLNFSRRYIHHSEFPIELGACMQERAGEKGRQTDRLDSNRVGRTYPIPDILTFRHRSAAAEEFIRYLTDAFMVDILNVGFVHLHFLVKFCEFIL